jgi:hypothetical protein
MVRQDWYRDLARINRRIADAREPIERKKKALISTLTQGAQSPESAIAFLEILNDTLQAMNSHRTNILVFVRIFPLPTSAGARIKGKRTGNWPWRQPAWRL